MRMSPSRDHARARLVGLKSALEIRSINSSSALPFTLFVNLMA